MGGKLIGPCHFITRSSGGGGGSAEVPRSAPFPSNSQLQQPCGARGLTKWPRPHSAPQHRWPTADVPGGHSHGGRHVPQALLMIPRLRRTPNRLRLPWHRYFFVRGNCYRSMGEFRRALFDYTMAIQVRLLRPPIGQVFGSRKARAELS